MSRLFKLVLVLIFPILLIAITSATMMANPDDEIIRIPVTEVASNDDENLRVNGSPIVRDGGFEGGSPNADWDEYATDPISIICNKSCTKDEPINFAHAGENWGWFGGFSPFVSTISQTVTIPVTTTAELEFYFRYYRRDTNGIGNDYFRVFMDGNQLFEVVDTEADFNTYGGDDYTKVTLNISPYADGQAHTLLFDSYIGDGEGVDDFFLDDVAINTNITSFVYLPIVLDCTPPAYSEILRYNQTIINAPAMWSLENSCITNQFADITIAVIDTGVDLDHPDLQANIVAGKTFVSDTSTPDDDQGHGSHVAGAAAAAKNNLGIIGIASYAQIMPIKVLNFEGKGSIAAVATGIRWAADNGANVINLSLGGSSKTNTEQSAVDYATSKGVLVIAAAGNCGDPNTYMFNNCPSLDSTSYPAAFNNAMAVASTNSLDQQSSFSTQAGYVEIAAPGSSIYSSVPSGGYAFKGGTSQATPHVAGLAAFIWSLNPSLTNTQIRAILNNTAVDLGTAGKDIQFGNGRIDAYAAAVQSYNVASLSVPSANAPNLSPPMSVNLDAPHMPGEILVKIADGYSVQSIDMAEALFADVFSTDEVTITENVELGIYELLVPEDKELAYLETLNGMVSVEYAELNYIVTVQ